MFKALIFIIHMQLVKKKFINENIFFAHEIDPIITKFVRRYQEILEKLLINNDIKFKFQIIGWSSTKIDEPEEHFKVDIKTGLKRLDVYKQHPNFGRRTGFKILSEELYLAKIENICLPFSKKELETIFDNEVLYSKPSNAGGFIDSFDIKFGNFTHRRSFLHQEIVKIYVNYFYVFLKYANFLGIPSLNEWNWNLISEYRRIFKGEWYNLVRYLTDSKKRQIMPDLELVNLKYTRLYSTLPNDDIFIKKKEEMGTYKAEIDSKKADYSQQDIYFEFKNVYIESHGIIYTDNTFYETDPALDSIQKFTAGRWSKLYGTSPEEVILQPLKRTLHIPRGVFLSTKDDSNWFHWVIEGLPRVLNYKEYFDPDTPLIITNDVSASGVNLLREIYNGPLKILPKSTRALVENLISLNPVSFHPDSLEVPSGKNIKINYRLMKEMQSYFINSRELILDTPNFEKLYLVRDSARRKLLNQEAIIRIVSENGYKAVDLSKIDPVLQFKLVHNAKKIIAPGGASMVSYLFADKDAKIATIVGENLKDFLVPFVLSDISGADHKYFIGNTVDQKIKCSKYEIQHLDFEVNIKDFERFVKNF